MIRDIQTCLDCSKGITNQICERCYTRQLALWMNDHGVDFEVINYITEEIKAKFPKENLNDSICILCRKKTVSICTCCYFFKIKRILDSLDLPEEMIEHFLQIFNYKLYNAAYGPFN